MAASRGELWGEWISDPARPLAKARPSTAQITSCHRCAACRRALGVFRSCKPRSIVKLDRMIEIASYSVGAIPTGKETFGGVSCSASGLERQLRFLKKIIETKTWGESRCIVHFSEEFFKKERAVRNAIGRSEFLSLRRRRRPPRLETGSHASLPSPQPFSR